MTNLCPQLTATQVAQEHGFTPRHWTRQAAAGKIPGARQPSGPGGQWLFDAAMLRRWWETRKREVEAWPGYTAEGVSIGRAPSVRTESTGEASRQRTERLLSNVLGRGSMNSTRLPGVTSRAGPMRKPKRNSFAST